MGPFLKWKEIQEVMRKSHAKEKEAAKHPANVLPLPGGGFAQKSPETPKSTVVAPKVVPEAPKVAPKPAEPKKD